MTRFARADGSKGSNKRIREDATPWKDLKPKKPKIDHQSAKPKDDTSISKKVEDNSRLVPKNNKKKENSTLPKQNENSQHPVKEVIIVHAQTEEDFKGNFQSEPIIDQQDESPEKTITETENKSDKKRTKKSKKKKKDPADPVTNVDKKHGFITENGNRYKVFKGGIKKPWLDIPYEENDIMTLYDKFFVKKEAVEELNNFKDSLQGLPDKVIKGKMMTKVRRAHNKLRIELMYNQINSMKGENGGNNNNKPAHKPGKAPKTNLPEENFVENEYMTNYEGYWVSRSQVGHLNRIRGWKIERFLRERTDENDSPDLTKEETNIINRQMKKEKRREHDCLCQKIKNKEFQSNLEDNNGFQPSSNKGDGYNMNNNDGFMDTDISFKGKSKMVQYDGFSVTKESAKKLTYLKDELSNKNFSEADISDTTKLEREKDETNLKQTKKLICFNCREPGHTVAQCRQTKTANEYHRRPLESNDGFQPSSNKGDGYNRNNNDGFMDTDRSFKGKSKMVQYDGFSVTKESAERLTYLKDELSNKNFSEAEISETLKLERRKDERDLKKTKKLICFNCREPGHTVAQCRQTKTGEICFKCGSTEHMSRNCNKQGSSYNHAQCFYCKKTGHLARECPDNPNGLYPDGGACRECGSNKHLVRDCPTAMENNSARCPTLKMMSAGDNPEDMDF